jgi:hypothetical protein
MRKTATERFMEKVQPEPNSGCWLWDGLVNRDGYGRFFLKGKPVGAHRASLLLRGAEIPDGMCVLHKCDVPACVNPDHLWIGTHADNVADRVAKGRSGAGPGHHPSKLDAAAVRSIRSLRAAGIAVRAIANMFEVVPGTVYAVLSGKTWCHVE